MTRLAAECGLPKTTAYRLLEQLLCRLRKSRQSYPGLRAAARAPARRLARLTGVTVALNVLREGQTLVLDWRLRDDVGAIGALQDGAAFPWFTAAGKVLVAGAPPRTPKGPVPAACQGAGRRVRP
ncbi:hypothetical protein [Streptomyces sp. 351MFTsu5.1]|uniref:hypothetical protein n=1 Tax=Streptomyces sp. 351MFTsu5.1 TaxID=1172180 RepID=UPI001F48E7C2|nr:hypothetical protein [Streptomyces sp. 351MFTsu5.1]